MGWLARFCAKREARNVAQTLDIARERASGRKADRVTWTFEWPAEALARDTLASTFDFAGWLREAGFTDSITRRQLVSLYAEFVEVHDLCPLSWGRLDRSLKAAGFERHRASHDGRPWLYRLQSKAPVLLLKRERVQPVTMPARMAA
jgi:hypothetical protein